ncbi:MAG: carboxyl-terminal processing protease [Anaerolineaceae bacterium]|nr:MAG: carboxyl-terminal processing protease [Anaerolineaceae bacterium]
MEKKNSLRSILLVLVAVVLVACSFGGGFATRHFLPLGASDTTNTPQQVDTAQGGTPEELQATFAPFWEAWQIVHENYVDQPVDDAVLVDGAIQGMMDSLGDPHTTYMNPQEYKDATTQLQGSYAGIGAYVDTDGEFLTIIKPIPGSPAEAAGLQPGDIILAVDGMDVTGVAPEAVRQKVLGPAGTQVTLTIRRGEQEPFDVVITRSTIVIPSVESKMLEDNIGYIKIAIFGESTASNFHDQLGEIMAQNPRGLIIDLRDNTGGYLDAAIVIASEFIPSGDVVAYEQYGDGTKTPFEAIPGGLATDPGLPVIVLVNGYSASASEIVAGAIQDTGRGKLLGETTYGKGSVQSWFPLSNNGAVPVTIARWLTPNGRTIDKLGLTPDVEVALTADDYAAGLDPQLEAAIQLLLNP